MNNYNPPPLKCYSFILQFYTCHFLLNYIHNKMSWSCMLQGQHLRRVKYMWLAEVQYMSSPQLQIQIHNKNPSEASVGRKIEEPWCLPPCKLHKHSFFNSVILLPQAFQLVLQVTFTAAYHVLSRPAENIPLLVAKCTNSMFFSDQGARYGGNCT